MGLYSAASIFWEWPLWSLSVTRRVLSWFTVKSSVARLPTLSSPTPSIHVQSFFVLFQILISGVQRWWHSTSSLFLERSHQSLSVSSWIQGWFTCESQVMLSHKTYIACRLLIYVLIRLTPRKLDLVPPHCIALLTMVASKFASFFWSANLIYSQKMGKSNLHHVLFENSCRAIVLFRMF
jgi:hypothetical protein